LAIWDFLPQDKKKIKKVNDDDFAASTYEL
jgi:hypothetical protein